MEVHRLYYQKDTLICSFINYDKILAFFQTEHDMKSIFYFFLISLFFNKLHSTDLDYSFQDHSNLILINDSKLIKFKDEYFLGIKINLKDKWKTYWKNPGDSGAPIQVDLRTKDSDNILKELLFPVPSRYNESEVETLGYENQVIFLAKIIELNHSTVHQTNLLINYLVCKEICIPVTVSKELRLDFKKAESGILNEEFLNASKKIPEKKNKVFTILKINQNNSKEISVYIETNKASKQKKLEIFNYSPDLSVQNTHSFSGDLIKVNLKSDEKITQNNIVELLITDGEVSEEITLNLTKTNGENPLYKMIFFAFLGGVILNLMPCVLPVISIKVFSFLKLASNNKKRAQKEIVSTIFGIVCSFFLISLITVILKDLGNEVGWGMQFQNFYFLSFFSILLLFFSLNLLGYFELIPPSIFINKLNSKNDNYYVNSFLTGFFATLLATPCTAPFLGTSIGFALTQDNHTIFLIFLFLSFGFSLPYFLFLLFPKTLLFLPKPGLWMIYFKKVLGFFVLLTAVWLFYLLKFNISFLLFFSFLIFFLSFFIEKSSSNFKKMLITSFCIVPMILILFLFNKNKNSEMWTKFDKNALQSLINNKNVVFVDITADWCITCQTNKILVLNSKKVVNFFNEQDITLIRGDWTDYDAKILAFLNMNKRSGIPFNIVYGPSNVDGYILPEILTKETIIKAIKLVK